MPATWPATSRTRSSTSWPPTAHPVIVDAHQHVWDPAARRHAWLDGLPALNRAFGLADFERASEPDGVTASVLVQVLPSTEETEEFLALAAGPGPVAGVVGWTDLASPAVADEIARLRALPGGNRLVGIGIWFRTSPTPTGCGGPRYAAASAPSARPAWPTTCWSGRISCRPRWP